MHVAVVLIESRGRDEVSIQKWRRNLGVAGLQRNQLTNTIFKAPKVTMFKEQLSEHEIRDEKERGLCGQCRQA